MEILEVSLFIFQVQWAWARISVCGDHWARVRIVVPAVPAFVTEFPGVWNAVSFQGVIGLCCGFLLEDMCSREG